MSITYTPATNFTAKDTMGTSNPDKTLSGVPFDAEFSAISTAFTLAATSDSPSFTGTTTTDVLVANTVNGSVTTTWDTAAATVTSKEAGWDATKSTVDSNASLWTATKVTVDAGATNWNTAFSWGDHAAEGYLVATAGDKANWNSTKATVDAGASSWNAAYNEKVNSIGFNNSNGVLTLTQQDASTLTVDLDGRYSVTDTNTQYTAGAGLSLSAGDEFSHADTSSQGSVSNTGNAFVKSITLDTFGHIQSISSADPSTTAYTAGSGLTLSGTAFSHTDTSSVSSSSNNGQTFIQSLTFDTFGHVQSVGTAVAANTNTTYTAGSGLSLSGTTFSHTVTSSQGSVNNSGNTFIQDITLDTFGHITSLASGTATSSDTTYSAGSGLTLSGTTFSVQPDLRDGITHVGLDSTEYVSFTNGQKVSMVVASTERVAATTSGATVTGTLSATAVTASGAVTGGSVKVGNFTVQLDGATNLRISHSTGGDLFNISSTGDLIVKGNVTAYGAP